MPAEPAAEPVVDIVATPVFELLTAPAEEPAPEEVVVAEVVEALAEADAVLVDEAGEAIPLATEEAAEILLAADPWFMAGRGVKHCFVPTSGGCTIAGCGHLLRKRTPIQDRDRCSWKPPVVILTARSLLRHGTYEENVIIDIEDLFLIGGVPANPTVNWGADGRPR